MMAPTDFDSELRKNTLVLRVQKTPLIVQPEDVDVLSASIMECVDEQHSPIVVLNLNGVRHVCSSMLGFFVKLQDRLARDDRKLRLCCLHPELADTFSVTQLDTVLEVRESEEAALKD